MDRGLTPDFSLSTAAAKASAAMASSFDRVCSGGGSSSEEDEEKQPLMMKQRQSLLQQNKDQAEHFRNSQRHLEKQQAGSSFPHIDIGANMNMNVNINIENFDFHALPIEIQLALEDTLLGWTHLTSITIGHLLLPCLVFYVVEHASKYILEQTVYTLTTNAADNVDRWASGNTSQTQTRAHAHAHTLEGDLEHAIEAVLVSPTTHAILGAVAAIAAFRVIRNRRRVWFRHAYGSKEYMTCEEGRRRRAAVLETDKHPSSLLSLSDYDTTGNSSKGYSWTSQMVSNYKRKRHKKKLKRASDRFERHHSSLSPRKPDLRPSSPSDRLGPITRLNTSKPEKASSDYDARSVAPTEDCYDSSSSTTSSFSEDDTPRQTQPREQSCQNNAYHRRTSIAQDAVSIPRIHNVPYAHGGFFGAAPFFLADKRWVKILRELLPDVYVEISRRLGGGYYVGQYLGRSSADASKLIHWAENNPVVAAYGFVMDMQMQKAQFLQETEKQDRHQKPGLLGGAGCGVYDTLYQERMGLFNNDDFSSEPVLIPENPNGMSNTGTIIDHFYQKQPHMGLPETIPTGKKDKKTSPNSNWKMIGEGKVEIPNLEWDIFVDPQLVRRVEAVLNTKDRYIQSKRKKMNKNNNNNSLKNNLGVATPAIYKCDRNNNDCCACCDQHRDDENENTEAVALLADQDNQMNTIASNLCASNTTSCSDCFSNNAGVDDCCDDLEFDPSDRNSIEEDEGEHPDPNDPVLQYLDQELKRRNQELTDRLLIAHGNVLQLITEQAGVLKDWNYSRVQRTRRTLGGGMYARQWMAVFAESLLLGMDPQPAGSHKSSQSNYSNKENHFANTRTDRDSHNFYESDDDGRTPDENAALLPLTGREEDDDPFASAAKHTDFHDEATEDDSSLHCTCSPKCCLDTTIAESVALIERITKTKQPIGILLDLKSRHVPKRVLSLILQSLQAAGIRVVGIASFEISDIRGVCSNDYYNAYGITHSNANATKEILMVHSAGDLQAACDEGLVQPGDYVFFNGGSLILDSARSSTVKSLLGFFFDMCVCGYYSTFDPCVIEDGYRIQSYGYACSGMETTGCFDNASYENFFGNEKVQKTSVFREKNVDEDSIIMSSSDNSDMGNVMRTLADYKRHYGFSMGLYLQEFSIDEAAARLLIELVNNNPSLYDLGLAWGGINGMTVHGIQPGRFTSTDGYWNQRRLGKSWRDQF